MSTIEHEIDIQAPIEMTFHHVTWFEIFPEFAKSVEEVRRDPADPAVLHGTLSLGTLLRESVARTAVDPERHWLSWHSESGLRHSGEIRLFVRSRTCTVLWLRMQFEPRGFAEYLGDRAGIVDRRVGHELRRFATYVESGGARCPARRRVPESGIDDRVHSVSEWMADHMFGKPDDTTWVRSTPGRQAGTPARVPAVRGALPDRGGRQRYTAEVRVKTTRSSSTNFRTNSRP